MMTAKILVPAADEIKGLFRVAEYVFNCAIVLSITKDFRGR